jgi:hypothetical protein
MLNVRISYRNVVLVVRYISLWELKPICRFAGAAVPALPAPIKPKKRRGYSEPPDGAG